MGPKAHAFLLQKRKKLPKADRERIAKESFQSWYDQNMKVEGLKSTTSSFSGVGSKTTPFDYRRKL